MLCVACDGRCLRLLLGLSHWLINLRLDARVLPLDLSLRLVNCFIYRAFLFDSPAIILILKVLSAGGLDTLDVVPVLADIALDPLFDAPECTASLATVNLILRLLRSATLVTFLLRHRRLQQFAIFAFKVDRPEIILHNTVGKLLSWCLYRQFRLHRYDGLWLWTLARDHFEFLRAFQWD